jgi:hypothetical protein
VDRGGMWDAGMEGVMRMMVNRRLADDEPGKVVVCI